MQCAFFLFDVSTANGTKCGDLPNSWTKCPFRCVSFLFFQLNNRELLTCARTRVYRCSCISVAIGMSVRQKRHGLYFRQKLFASQHVNVDSLVNFIGMTTLGNIGSGAETGAEAYDLRSGRKTTVECQNRLGLVYFGHIIVGRTLHARLLLDTEVRLANIGRKKPRPAQQTTSSEICSTCSTDYCVYCNTQNTAYCTQYTFLR